MIETVLAVAAFSLSLLGVLWKVFTKISSLDHKIDKLELVTNGTRERMEHINTRLAGEHRELEHTINGIDGYLQKHTNYERRA